MASKELAKPSIALPQQTENYRPWLISPDAYPHSADTATQLRFLLNWAVLAPSSHNTQPWGFLVEENKVTVLPDLDRRLPESDVSNRELYISVGAALTNLQVAAKRFGWSLDIKFMHDETENCQAQITFKPGYTPTPDDVDLFNAIPKRVNYDGEHQRIPLSQEALLSIQRFFGDRQDINLSLVTDYPTKQRVAELIEAGDRIIFNNKKFIAELVRWMRDASTKRKDGILTSAMGLPRELRRYAARLLLTAKGEITNAMARGDKEKVKNSAAIGVISTQKDHPEIWMQVGALYELASLAAVKHGVLFGARAVLIETENLHEELEKTVGIEENRAQMMFRLGYPATSLQHSPRLKSAERMVTIIEGARRVPPVDRPTLFKLNAKYTLNHLLGDLGDDVDVESVAFTEHWLPDLYSVMHPELDNRSQSFQEGVRQFVEAHNDETEGVWAYLPHQRRLMHLLSEDEFYAVITANNCGIISKEAQARMKWLRIGVAGLSGSGKEIARDFAMSGGEYLRIGDFDFRSPRNGNRMTGDVGENKTWIAAWELWEHNPFLDIELFPEGITKDNVGTFINGLDVICDQTDSSSKFWIRQEAKDQQLVAMVTDMENPKVELERDNKSSFGGRADQAGISAETMENIESLAEATAYVAILIGTDEIPTSNYCNFRDILMGRADAFGQTFMAVQAGAGAMGRVFLAIAEGKVDQLPDSWVIQTRPELPGEKEEQEETRREFLKTYAYLFGEENHSTV